MPTIFDHLTGAEVDTASEAWRHACECRWLLEKKPTRTDKHLWLFGVTDRQQIVTPTGQLRQDWLRIAERKSITHLRGLAAADKILADARRLHELNK